MVRTALPHLKENDTIVNTSSILGLIGKEFLIDYSASKGVVNTFTKALAQNLARKIRVNAIAPGPVWTPNILARMPEELVDNFDTDVAMKEAVTSAESIGMTVSDMDEAVEFYAILSFQKISDVEVLGTEYECLQGLFGVRMRVVQKQLGSELIKLTEYLTPNGTIPIDSRSND